LRKQLFINCWVASETESVPMWKIYGSYDQGIAIKSTVNSFKRSLRGSQVDMLALTVGLVRYYREGPQALFDYNKGVEFSWDSAAKVSRKARLLRF
jgi:hypothetical protein